VVQEMLFNVAIDNMDTIDHFMVMKDVRFF
jgi:hypothetical protein